MRIFLNSNINLNDEEYLIENEEDKRHILLVMRKTAGEFLEVVDSKKEVYEAQITNIKPLTIKPIKELVSNEPSVQIDIFQGIPKLNKMEYIIEKAVELGAKDVYAVQMERSVVKLQKKDVDKKIERWNKIAKSAAQQSKRNIISKIQYINKIQNIDFSKYDLSLYLDTKSTEDKFKLNLLSDANIKTIAVVIGPEGGFSDDERKYLYEKIKLINLGPRIFRTETASAVILSLLQYLLGDFED